MKRNTKHLFAGIALSIAVVACFTAPSESAIQTAIAQTQIFEGAIQTAILQTATAQPTVSYAVQFTTNTLTMTPTFTSTITLVPITSTPLIPTSTIIPSAPILPPTNMPNTLPGTVLKVGDDWYADGIELRLAQTIFDSDGLNIGHSCYIVRLEMANWSTTPIYFTLDKNVFWITDNLGRRYEMEMKFHEYSYCSVQGYSSPIEVKWIRKFRHEKGHN